MRKTYIYAGVALVLVIGGLLYMLTTQNNKSSDICANTVLEAKRMQKEQNTKQIKKLEDTNKKLEETNKKLEDEMKKLKESGTNVANNNCNTNVSTNNYTKIFASEDDKYVLTLTEFNRKSANPKVREGIGTLFTLSIISYLESESLHGSYRYDNGTIILYGNAGCLAYPNKDSITCMLPANTKTEKVNVGNTPTITLSYTDQKVMLGDVALYLR